MQCTIVMQIPYKILPLSIKTTFIVLCFLWHGNLTAQRLSPLSSSQVFKIECENPGVYKLDYAWLSKNTDLNLSSIDPTKIQIWSGKKRLTQSAIEIVGENDGKFDQGDYIIFYGEGGDQYINGYAKNPFSEENFYFLTLGPEKGLRVNKPNSISIEGTPNNTSIRTNVYEEDLFNLLEESNNNSGSGQMWVGQEISNNKITKLGSAFNFSTAVGGPTRIKATLLVRSDETEKIKLHFGDQSFERIVAGVSLGDPEERYARNVVFDETFNLTDTEIKNAEISIEFIKSSPNGQAWIDDIEIEYVEHNRFDGTTKTIYPNTSAPSEINISTSTSTQIWQYIRQDSILELDFITNKDMVSVSISDNAPLILFDPSGAFLTPAGVQKIAPRDIRNIGSIDMAIVYHSLFEKSAERLANHRSSFSQLNVAIINVEDIYNEYGSGQHTPEAIRWFAQDMWDSQTSFKYLLLFGDGSYDYRGISKTHAYQSFVPTYETLESFDPILSFPTDDYFALLDESDPERLAGDLDIAVGRLTVRTENEAEAVVTKIINYDISKNSDAIWKSRIAFLADDEDYNLHLNDADRIAEMVSQQHPELNIQKIYWDAFVQQSTPGGNRYPEANNRINEIIDQGLLVMNYLGHGGPIGWSQERVLYITDIDSWTNFDKLPLIVTATCSFTGFDDPNITSAGEAALLNPVGGAVALYTTVRSVYASKNFRLTQSVFDTLFTKENGQYLPIGEILRRSKNSNPTDNTNARKFLLIGDPSMLLSLPTYTIATTTINGKSTDSQLTDTLGALSNIQLTGAIKMPNGLNDESFEGTVDVLVYDKSSNVKTLANDPTSISKSFKVQNNIIFKAKASVKKGQFTVAFTVPVDINYSPGKAKISYFAVSNKGVEAMGYFDNLILSGTSAQNIPDDKGPDIKLYLNDRTFINGGETGPNPLLLIDINDDNGINLSTASIGHEITAILDNNTQNTVILNDLFVSPIDGFTSGSISYSYTNLAPGPHQIKVKAFDVANNLGEATVDFEVIKEENPIFNLKNSPNPFVDQTLFSFSHSLTNNNLTATIEIFDMSGRLIKEISQNVISQNRRFNNIFWNGTGYNGSLLPKGNYLYRLKIKSPELSKTIFSEFNNLIILK